MAVDGTAHFLSDLGGIGEGFRDANLWLVAVTGNRLPISFYYGDALGTFNSWMRLITGVLFGVGLVWAAFPHLHAGFRETARQIKTKFERAGIEL